MSTNAQINANRANAERSSGPKTEEGKAASSRNHHAHGLSTHSYNDIFFLLPRENADAYSLLRASLLYEHRPENETERLLVDRMAQHHWLRSRAKAFESGCFKRRRHARRQAPGSVHALPLAELLKLRAERRKTEIGFGMNRKSA